MKKFKVFALVFAIMLSATGLGILFGSSQPASTQAKVSADDTTDTFDATDTTNWTFTTDDTAKTYTITKYNGSATNVIINGKVGDYSVYITCEDNNPIFQQFNSLKSVVFGADGNKVKGKDSLACLFQYCQKAEIIDVKNLDTSAVTNMWRMFGTYNTDEPMAVTSLYVSGFDTSNVTSMRDMFSGCDKLTELNVNNFNTENVKDLSGMFDSCRKLTTLNLSNFNTINTTTMRGMFIYCSALETINFGKNFDTSKVTDFQAMFAYCKSLTSLDLSTFEISEDVTDYDHMFSGTISLQTLVVPSQIDSESIAISLPTTYKYTSVLGGEITTKYLVGAIKADGTPVTLTREGGISTNADFELIAIDNKYYVTGIKGSIYEGDKYECLIIDSVITLTRYLGTNTIITLPATVANVKVGNQSTQANMFFYTGTLSSNENFFGENCNSITKIVMGGSDGIASMGLENLFSGLTNLSFLEFTKTASGDTATLSKLGIDNSKLGLKLYDKDSGTLKDIADDTEFGSGKAILTTEKYFKENPSEFKISIDADFIAKKTGEGEYTLTANCDKYKDMSFVVSQADFAGDPGQCTIIKYTGTSENVIIPATFSVARELENGDYAVGMAFGMIGLANSFFDGNEANIKSFDIEPLPKAVFAEESEMITDDFAMLMVDKECTKPFAKVTNLEKISLPKLFTIDGETGDIIAATFTLENLGLADKNLKEFDMASKTLKTDNLSVDFEVGSKAVVLATANSQFVKDNASGGSTPSTGVVLDVVLPAFSIVLVLASLCAVAFVGKKKKQF